MISATLVPVQKREKSLAMQDYKMLADIMYKNTDCYYHFITTLLQSCILKLWEVVTRLLLPLYHNLATILYFETAGSCYKIVSTTLSQPCYNLAF